MELLPLTDSCGDHHMPRPEGSFGRSLWTIYNIGLFYLTISSRQLIACTEWLPAARWSAFTAIGKLRWWNPRRRKNRQPEHLIVCCANLLSFREGASFPTRKKISQVCFWHKRGPFKIEFQDVQFHSEQSITNSGLTPVASFKKANKITHQRLRAGVPRSCWPWQRIWET